MTTQTSNTNSTNTKTMTTKASNNTEIMTNQTSVINQTNIQTMDQNTLNTIMETPKFVLETVNPNGLKVHNLLTEMGFDNKPDAVYIQTVNLFKYYEKPVVDCNNNIITHSAEVLAAIANGVQEIEVYKTNMTEKDFRIFISLKHTYNIKNLIATYNTINFYIDYFNNDEQGKLIAQSLNGKTTKKIADFMQTSDSTIKRVKSIGDYDLSKLGLIEQGYVSFKEIENEIKLKRMQTNSANRKAGLAQTELPADVVNNEVKYYEPTTGQDENDSPLEATENYYEGDADNQETDLPAQTWTTSITSEMKENLLSGYLNFEGFGEFEISIDDNTPTVKQNGESIKDITYTGIVNREDSGNGSSKSFIITQNGKQGVSIHITLENFRNAA